MEASLGLWVWPAINYMGDMVDSCYMGQDYKMALMLV